MDIETIYNKLTNKRLGVGRLGRTWKHGKGAGENQSELTPEERDFLCEKVVERVPLALKIFGHIYNASKEEAFRRCSPAETDSESDDEDEARGHAAATASGKRSAKNAKKNAMVQVRSSTADQYGGRRRRRRKSRRKKKSRKSKRRKGLNSKKRRRRKRRTKKR